MQLLLRSPGVACLPAVPEGVLVTAPIHAILECGRDASRGDVGQDEPICTRTFRQRPPWPERPRDVAGTLPAGGTRRVRALDAVKRDSEADVESQLLGGDSGTK